MTAPPNFPAEIPCRLGTLVYRQLPLGDSKSQCLYEINLEPNHPHGNGLRVSVHPPEVGITDVSRAAAYIDQTWDAIRAQMPRILADAVPLVTEAVLADYGSEPCPVERIPDMLTSGRLQCVCLNLDGDHWFYLEGNDLINLRDVATYLSGTLRVTKAHLDG